MRYRDPDILTLQDRAVIALVILTVVGVWKIGRWIVNRPPAVVRYQMLPARGGGCRVEVWMNGKPGDRFLRLTGGGKGQGRAPTGIAIVGDPTGSADLPLTLKTSHGTCGIGRYHLVINGHEVDQIDGLR